MFTWLNVFICIKKTILKILYTCTTRIINIIFIYTPIYSCVLTKKIFSLHLHTKPEHRDKFISINIITLKFYPDNLRRSRKKN